MLSSLVESRKVNQCDSWSIGVGGSRSIYNSCSSTNYRNSDCNVNSYVLGGINFTKGSCTSLNNYNVNRYSEKELDTLFFYQIDET